MGSRTFEKTIGVALAIVWAGVFVFGVQRTWVDGGVAPVHIEAAAESEGYPTLLRFRDGTVDLNPQLRVGDRLIRVGDADLQGVGPLEFFAVVPDRAGSKRTVELEFERDGVRRTTELRLVPVRDYVGTLVISAALGLTGILGVARLSGRPIGRIGVPALFIVAIQFGTFTAGPFGATLLIIGLRAVATALGEPLILRAIMLFPEERPPRTAWARYGPWIFALQAPADLSAGYGALAPYSIGMPVASALGLSCLGCILVVLTRNYLAADPIGRRQMRWFVLSAYLGILPMALALPLILVDERWTGFVFNTTAALAIVPVGLVIGIARYNWFDVDRLLSETASFNLLGVLAIGTGLVVVPRAAEAASTLLGLDPELGRVAFSLGLAALVVPAQRRVRPLLDRVFFRERYATDHGVAELLSALSSCGDARELTERVGDGLVTLLRPETCAIYSRSEDSYAPVFVDGQTAPAAFDAHGPLTTTLQGRPAPLALAGGGRQPDEAALGAFDRAALETLGAEVVIPIHQGDTLSAFLCLGPKRSGDVYTPTDLSLLGALGETVSQQLVRFDQEQTIREGRAMQESLRRYVPGAIAEELAEGTDLSSREREVSVLFVDIRGYTGLSEGRRAEDIFDTINQYTETVSAVVRRHRGAVVEFNGDGMMAVFGAPRELPEKERAAVEAGRQIVSAVSALRVEDAEGRTRELSVGVGIATGEACVGNIRAVDRMIWSAIGNTTNLAARLQSLTRELDASVVVDVNTREHAGDACRGFEPRPDVAIRGSRQRRDLFALPLAD